MFHFIPSHDNSFYICKACAEKFNNTVLVDFNINVVANNNIQQVISQYPLINYEPTRISRSLYHVYINRKTLQKISIEAIRTASVYFSDHHAVKFKLRLL